MLVFVCICVNSFLLECGCMGAADLIDLQKSAAKTCNEEVCVSEQERDMQ